MSSKALQESPFRRCSASPEINTKTSLTPAGPRAGTMPRHDSPARHLIHYISAAASFRSAGLGYSPARLPTLYLPLLAV